ncbi:MAG TPA: nascent polypeptide-associated complex protein [Thermoplasmatales archaeon]|nr:nascent polypeptide-associated complex protein [Candidatus Thermoplasmatota archaeon]HDS59783.1 nascent polypeptide-associated complex protein [Thermoplasmatales archaeon]
MMPNVDPRQLQKIMKRMGMSVDEIEGVEEVIIRTADREYVFTGASVSVMNVKGEKTYQVSGTPKIVDRLSPQDVALVAEKTGRSREEARAALQKADGDIAQAILDLSA